MKFLKAVLICGLLSACGEDDTGNREVIALTSPDGHSFQFMPIIEDGVSDITVTIAWATDWSYDAANHPAVPFVGAEAILSGGTSTLKPQALLEVFDDANAGGHLSAGADYIYGELGFPREYTDKIVPLAAEMLAKPQLDPAWVSRIAAGLMANQEQSQAQSATQMWMAARVAIFDDAPILGYLSLPDTKGIADVTRDMVFEWHRQTLTQDTAAIVVTGAINAADAGRVVDTLLGQLPQGPARPAGVSAPNFAQRTILLHLPDAEKTTIGLIGQLPPTREGNDLVDLLAVRILGNSDGPLFDAVRSELRASYGLQAGYANFDRSARVLFITGEVEGEKLVAARDVILQTYADFRQDPQIGDFEKLRDGLAEGTDDNVKYVNVAAQTIREFLLDGQDVKMAPKLGDVIRQITIDDVQMRLRSAFPKADDLIVIVASPDADALPGACVITQILQAATCP